MHEEFSIRITIDTQKYHTAFHEWKRDKQNKDKNSNDFDREIGIGCWRQKNSVLIKNKKLFFLASLKYNL